MSSSLALFGGKPAVSHPPAYSWPPITESDIALIVEMLQRKELSYYGREGEVLELEDAFKAYLNVQYGLATSSGTAALHSAFFGLGLGPGDEVLAPTFTFLGAILDKLQPVSTNQSHDSGHIAGMTLHMGDDQSLGPGRDSPFNVQRIDVAGIGFGIDQNREGVYHKNRHHS